MINEDEWRRRNLWRGTEHTQQENEGDTKEESREMVGGMQVAYKLNGQWELYLFITQLKVKGNKEELWV